MPPDRTGTLTQDPDFDFPIAIATMPATPFEIAVPTSA